MHSKEIWCHWEPQEGYHSHFLTKSWRRCSLLPSSSASDTTGFPPPPPKRPSRALGTSWMLSDSHHGTHLEPFEVAVDTGQVWPGIHRLQLALHMEQPPVEVREALDQVVSLGGLQQLPGFGLGGGLQLGPAFPDLHHLLPHGFRQLRLLLDQLLAFLGTQKGRGATAHPGALYRPAKPNAEGWQTFPAATCTWRQPDAYEALPMEALLRHPFSFLRSQQALPKDPQP